MARVHVYINHSSVFPILKTKSDLVPNIPIKEEKPDDNESDSNQYNTNEDSAEADWSAVEMNSKQDQDNTRQVDNQKNKSRVKPSTISIAQHYINITKDSFDNNCTDNLSNDNLIINDKDIDRNLRQRDSSKQPNLVKCKVCTAIFSDLPALKKHITRFESHKLSCHICFKSFDKPIDLISHRRSTHRGYDWTTHKYKCSYCHLTFVHKNSITHHLHHYHDINKEIEKEERKNYRRQKNQLLSDKRTTPIQATKKSERWKNDYKRNKKRKRSSINKIVNTKITETSNDNKNSVTNKNSGTILKNLLTKKPRDHSEKLLSTEMKLPSPIISTAPNHSRRRSRRSPEKIFKSSISNGPVELGLLNTENSVSISNDSTKTRSKKLDCIEEPPVKRLKSSVNNDSKSTFPLRRSKRSADDSTAFNTDSFVDSTLLDSKNSVKSINDSTKGKFNPARNSNQNLLDGSDGKNSTNTDILDDYKINLKKGKIVYRSSLCTTRYTTQKKLVLHYVYSHTDQRLKKCPICEEPYEIITELKSHLLIHCIAIPKSSDDHSPLNPKKACSNRIKYPCDECKREFYLSECLEKHKVTCKGIQEENISKVDDLKSDKNLTSYSKAKNKSICTSDQLDINDRTCQVCNTIFRNRLRYIEHSLYYYDGIDIGCAVCNKTFSGQYIAHSHKKIEHYSDDMKRTFNNFCNECNEGFEYKSHLHSHIYHIHKNHPHRHLLYNQIENTIKKNDNQLHNCNVCNENFKSTNLLAKHLLEYSNYGSYKCNYCSRMYSSDILLNNHIKLSHSNNQSSGGIECPLCHEIILPGCSSISHIKHHHYENQDIEIFKKMLNADTSNYDESNTNTEVMCNDKDKNSENAKNFDDIADNNNDTFINCNENDETSKIDDQIVVDRNIMEVNVDEEIKIEYTCAICDMKFLSSAGLKIHGLKHTSAPFEFNIHGNEFNQNNEKNEEENLVCTDSLPTENLELENANLNNFDAISENTNDGNGKNDTPDFLIQDICSVELKEYESSFGNVQNTDQNIPTNYGNISFNLNEISAWKCNICLEVFNSVKKLDNHLKSYSNIGNYKCNTCNRRFLFSKNYNKHIIKHKNFRTNVPFYCLMCNESFASIISRKIHFAHLHRVLLIDNETTDAVSNIVTFNAEQTSSKLSSDYQNPATSVIINQNLPTSSVIINQNQPTTSVVINQNPPNSNVIINQMPQAPVNPLLQPNPDEINAAPIINSLSTPKTIVNTKERPSTDSGCLPFTTKFLCEFCGLPLSDLVALSHHTNIHKMKFNKRKLSSLNDSNKIVCLNDASLQNTDRKAEFFDKFLSTSTATNLNIASYEQKNSQIKTIESSNCDIIKVSSLDIQDNDDNPKIILVKTNATSNTSNDFDSVTKSNSESSKIEQNPLDNKLTANDSNDKIVNNNNKEKNNTQLLVNELPPSNENKNLVVLQEPVSDILCKICSEKFVSIHDLIDHYESFHNVMLKRLPYLLFVEGYNPTAKNANTHDNSEYQLQCHMCSLTFNSIISLRDHNKDTHGIDLKSVKYVFNKRIIVNNQNLNCQICNKKLPNVASLKAHVFQNHYNVSINNKLLFKDQLGLTNNSNDNVSNNKPKESEKSEVIEMVNEKKKLPLKFNVKNTEQGTQESSKSYNLIPIPGNKLIIPEKFAKKK